MRLFLRLVLALSVLLCAFPGGARAQTTPPQPGELNIQQFDAAVGKYVYFTQHGANVPDHLQFGIGLMFDFQRNPFTIYNVDASGNRGDVRTSVVENLLTGELYGYLGLFKHISVGLSMPLALYMTGTTTDESGLPASGGELSTFAWGDLGVHIKGHLYTIKSAGISFGALLTITAPLGQFSEAFIGDALPTFRPRLIMEYRSRVFSAAGNLGALLRIKETSFYDGSFKQGQAFTYGVGLAIRPASKIPLRIMIEWFGRTDFSGRVDRSPMEVGGGLGYGLPRGFDLHVGATAGVLAGIGTPDFRVFFGVRWAPSFADGDNDGVLDENDKCPDQKEDKDGFADDDGCPDPDNDRDGIDDANDKCPNKPEDFDKFQDTDGCPDPDNDGDGIPDKQDNCPMNKGAAKDKGCPPDMLDDDGDGIPNTRDKCPQKAEDKDGFADADGCPDPDNDGDGIPDDQDQCKNAAEDKDGNADADGCPDPDDDGDGVCDDNPMIQRDLAKFISVCVGRDRCPGKRETINGRKDLDGCPDRGLANVKLSAKAGGGYQGRFVAVGIRKWFAGTSTKMTRKARKMLLQLAMMLRKKAYAPLKQIVVMAYTEPQLGKAKAKKVSRGWADTVRSFLVGQGIAADRLVAMGAGGSDPKCRRASRRCRRKNRRVEFYITKIQK